MLAGEEYGSGSSRDWAAKGPNLLGVRFVLARSYERIHRSNLVGMGVLPLQFPDGESVDSLGLTGTETFDLAPLEEGAATLRVSDVDRRRVRRARAHRHAERVAVLPPRRDPALRPAPAAGPAMTAGGRVRALGVDHVALEVDSVDAALEWCCGSLTFELRGRRPGMAWIDLGD